MYIYICIVIYTCVYIHINIYICVYKCIHMYTYTSRLSKHLEKFPRIAVLPHINLTLKISPLSDDPYSADQTAR